VRRLERQLRPGEVGPQSKDVEEPALGAPLQRDAAVVDQEMRILALLDAERRGGARQRTGLEGAIDVEPRRLGRAPRQRNRDSRAFAEDVHDARLRSVRPPIPIVVIEDREEHQPRAKLAEQARRLARLCDAGFLVDENHERDLVHRERPIALADLDLVEASAVAQPFFDRGDSVRVERRSDGDAGQLDHQRVGHRDVAMDADFRDLLRRRLDEQGERDQRGGQRLPSFGTLTFDVTSALR
jgi:hypothetical protein